MRETDRIALLGGQLPPPEDDFGLAWPPLPDEHSCADLPGVEPA